ILEPVADLVGRAADGDEVARPEQLARVFVRDALARDRALEDLADACLLDHAHATAAPAVWTKRSSGTVSSRPASRASSRNVYRPARSRGPKRYRSFSKYRARKPAG